MNLVGREFECHLAARAGKHRHAAQCVEQLCAVDRSREGAVGGYHRVVVGVTAIDEAARQRVFIGDKHSTLGVESHLQVAILLVEHAAKNRSGLRGQNE